MKETCDSRAIKDLISNGRLTVGQWKKMMTSIRDERCWWFISSTGLRSTIINRVLRKWWPILRAKNNRIPLRVGTERRSEAIKQKKLPAFSSNRLIREQLQQKIDFSQDSIDCNIVWKVPYSSSNFSDHHSSSKKPAGIEPKIIYLTIDVKRLLLL